MQPIDPADKRQPNVQIAAASGRPSSPGNWNRASSCPRPRAGQLLRGQPHDGPDRDPDPAGRGFRAQPGRQRRLRPRAGQPARTRRCRASPSGAAAFLFEMGQLKNQPRSGWQLLGIQRPESVAEHSFRDRDRRHHAGRDRRRRHRPHRGAMHLARCARDPDRRRARRRPRLRHHRNARGRHRPPDRRNARRASKAIQELIAEYEDNQTPEARLAHDADKIEMLIQAIEYEAHGARHQPMAGQRPRRPAHRSRRRTRPRRHLIQPPMVGSLQRLLLRTPRQHSLSQAAARQPSPVTRLGRTPDRPPL